MSDSFTPRRSGRQRTANRKYDDQVEWTQDTLRLIRAESNSPDRSSDSSAPNSPKQTNKDVAFAVAQEEIKDGDDDDDAFEIDSASEDSHDQNDVDSISTDEDGRDSTIYPSTPSKQLKQRQRSYPKSKTQEPANEKGQRSRMWQQEDRIVLRGSVKKVYAENWGLELADLYPILRSRDIWHLDPRDIVLPSRTSIAEAMRLEREGRYLSWKASEDSPTQQTQMITHVNGHAQPSHQSVTAITHEYAAAQRYFENDVQHDIILGSWGQMKKFEPSVLESINIAEAYKQDQTADIGSYHGWAVNFGARPTSMAWAPCDADTQFLAVAFSSTARQRQAAEILKSTHAPAFSPSPLYPAHIQILKVFAAPGDASEPARLSHDPRISPELHQRLCTRWGDILRFEWLLTTSSTVDNLNRTLVVLFSDGNIRLINTNLSETALNEINTPHLLLPAPSTSVLTCFCLASPTDVIAGDSHGSIYLFDLCQPVTDGTLHPWTAIQIHNTYIMSLTSATDYPNFLASQSAAGEIILTDLRAPHQDRVVVKKARLPTRNLAYYPFTRSFLTTSDSVGNAEATGTTTASVQSHTLRHFYTTQMLLKLPDLSGVLTVLATSSFHPIILVANASGQVFASNVMKRQMPIDPSAKVERVNTWMLKVYDIDWAAKPEQRTQSNEGEHEDQMDVDPPQYLYQKPQQEQSSQRSPNNNPSYQFIPAHSTSSASTGQSGSRSSTSDIFHCPPLKPGTYRIHTSFAPALNLLPNKHHQRIKAQAQAKAEAQAQTQTPKTAKPKPESTPKTSPTSAAASRQNTPARQGSEKESAPTEPSASASGTVEISPSQPVQQIQQTQPNSPTAQIIFPAPPPPITPATDPHPHHHHPARENPKEREREKEKREANSQIILPKEQAVTAMAWNMNPRFSGWCCVGWGGGVVVVRDFGVDT